jgi:hypothetical protein
MQRVIVLAQLPATAAVLGWVPGNPAKLLALLVVWGLGFGPIRVAEFLAMAGVNALFVLMNQAALRRGLFAFHHPDRLGMPVYEYLMWGFYTLHAIRLLDGAAPRGNVLLALAAAFAFALPFATVGNPPALLATSGLALAVGFVLFHEAMDFAYSAYMAAIGIVIEHVGVGSGQWHYPGSPLGGVPPWSLTMWAGIGLFTRRLLLPMLYRRGQRDRANGRLGPVD